MPYSGAGAIWHLGSGEFLDTNKPGDVAGLAAALAAIVAAGGGGVQVGPGLEAVPLVGFSANTVLHQITKDGRIVLSGLRLADVLDPTKRVHLDLAGLAAATDRVLTAHDWDGHLIVPASEGLLGQFLRSGGPGVQPAWASAVDLHNLLDGSVHPDTLAGVVAAGDLIFGNATPKWARLAKGLDGQVLTLVAGLPVWSGTGAVLLEHNALAHIRAVRATPCSISSGSAVLTTTGSQFANVKAGDLVNGDIFGVDLQGATVSVWTDANTVTLSRTKTSGGNITNAVCIFTPSDHWAAAISEANGYMIAAGRGTYEPTANSGGDFQELRGPINWRGYSNGIVTDFRVECSAGTATLSGFAIHAPGVTARMYFFLPAGFNTISYFTTAAGYTGANPYILVDESIAQTLTNKTLTVGNKIRVDGTATLAVFQNGGGADRLGFDLTPMSALRATKWADHAGTVRVQALVTPTYGVTVATDVNAGTVFKITVTDGVAFTVSNPTLSGSDTLAGKEITYDILNSSGGAMGAITWGGQFLLAGAFTNPANTKRRTIRFYWDGTNWVEICRAAADI